MTIFWIMTYKKSIENVEVNLRQHISEMEREL